MHLWFQQTQEQVFSPSLSLIACLEQYFQKSQKPCVRCLSKKKKKQRLLVLESKMSHWRGSRLDDIQHVMMIPLMRGKFVLGILEQETAFNSLDTLVIHEELARVKCEDVTGASSALRSNTLAVLTAMKANTNARLAREKAQAH